MKSECGQSIPANFILGRKFMPLIIHLQVFHYFLHNSIWVLSISSITIVRQFWKKNFLHKIITLLLLHKLPNNSSTEMLQICFATDFKAPRRNFGKGSVAPLKQVSCMRSIGGEMHSSIILCNKAQFVPLLFSLSMDMRQLVEFV